MNEALQRNRDVSPSNRNNETYYIGGNSGKVTFINLGDVKNPIDQFFVDISFRGAHAYMHAEALGQFFNYHSGLFHISTRKIIQPKNESGFVLSASAEGKQELERYLKNSFDSLTDTP